MIGVGTERGKGEGGETVMYTSMQEVEVVLDLTVDEPNNTRLLVGCTTTMLGIFSKLLFVRYLQT